jgi:FAD/FMN-containing dehydrogenase
MNGQKILFPESGSKASEMIRQTMNEKKFIVPAGRRFRLGCWPTLQNEQVVIISSEKLNQIKSVEPDNLLAVVEAGTTPAQVRDSLEPLGLYWPVSGLDDRSLGAIMAEGAISLENMSRGSILDWILGATFIEPSGKIIVSGGQTLKNVSGFDLTRFLWKSWGSLGFSLSFILKCLPKPAVSKVLKINLPNAQAAIDTTVKIIKNKTFPQTIYVVYDSGQWFLLIWFVGFNESIEILSQKVSFLARDTTPIIYEQGLKFFNDYLKNWASPQTSILHWLGTRQNLLKLIERINGLENNPISKANIDIGGGQVRLALNSEMEKELWPIKQQLMGDLFPLGPNLEGEVYTRLKKGLDPDNLFFPGHLYFQN